MVTILIIKKTLDVYNLGQLNCMLLVNPQYGEITKICCSKHDVMVGSMCFLAVVEKRPIIYNYSFFFF